MATITEDYVSFETARLLVKKGFDFNAEYESYYTLRGVIVYFKDKTQEINIAPRITLQMAMKWLREAHGITIIIDTNDIWLDKGNRFYWCKIYYKMGNRIEIKWYNDPSKPKDILRYQTYEQACEEAIKYCLKNLI